MKSNHLSETLRSEGNKLYSERNFYEALLKYNESLCKATSDSENLGLAYANRSAVYFEMKLFDHSLRNIEFARNHNYPSKNFEILSKREEKCRALKDQQIKLFDHWSYFKLRFKPNPKLPFVANCLELNISEKYGKHIVTNQSLKVGDILAIEKPFCSVLLSESRFVEVDKSNKFQRCGKCLRDNQLDLIPCDSCCEVMFCSTECKEFAFKRFHRYECPVINSITKSGSVNIALRLFFISLSVFDGSVEKLEIFMKENENRTSTVFDFDFTGDDSENHVKNYLKSLNSLSKSSKTFSLQNHSEILSGHPELRDTWALHEDFIRSFLQKQCQINDLYFHGIFSSNLKLCESKNPSTIFTDLQQSIGSGWFPFCSLINHSCAPNVLRIYVEGRVVLIACRPIERGSQLFDCYKANFNKQLKADRQQRLQKEFNFICDCEACEKDYPSPPNLGFKDMKVLKFAKKINEEILNLKPNQAEKKYRDCCEIFDKNHQAYPSLELSLLQKCIAMFLLYRAKPPSVFP